MRLVLNETPAELRPWRVRTSDGRVRGPLGIEQVKSLLDVGLAKPTDEVSAVDREEWTPIEEHAMWATLQPKRFVTLPESDLLDRHQDNALPAHSMTVSPEMQMRMSVKRKVEADRVSRSVAYWQFGRAVRGVREAAIFLTFVTVGDLLVSFIDARAGIVRLGALLAVLATACVYYSFKVFENKS